MNTAIFVLLAINLAILILLLRKVIKVHIFCWDLKSELATQTVQTIRNVEALNSLYHRLDLKMPLPPTMGFAGAPDFLRHVTDYAARADVENILECSSGLSTIVIAQAMKQKGRGHVYSLEHDAKYAAITRDNIKKYGLADWATVITAPLTGHNLAGQSCQWYDIKGKLPEIVFDGLVIDGPPCSVSVNARYPAGPLLFGLLGRNAHVFLDDYIREEEQKSVDMWLAENPGMVLQKHAFMKGCAELVVG